MAQNKNLSDAKRAKKDEFYTQLDDISNELRHYREHFRGKTVLCNCDDPYESKFFQFFALKFNAWGLHRLICTCYDGSSIAYRELSIPFDGEKKNDRKAYKVELTEVTDVNGDGATDLLDVCEILRQHPPVPLKGNGDFRSPECVALLQEADIVVTNPPFSLFREYVAQLMKYDKKFLIIGHQNAITYKEIFPLIKENKIWLGYGFKGGAAHFMSPYEDKATAGDHKEGMIRVSGVNWFTNLDHSKRHEELDLYKTYSPDLYPHYDNYDAIEVGKTADIPMDYEGAMGVPITFMDKFNPEQFEILGMCENEDLYSLKTRVYNAQERKDAYQAKFGKKGSYDLNASAVLVIKGRYEKVYQRILIRHKHPHRPSNNLTTSNFATSK